MSTNGLGSVSATTGADTGLSSALGANKSLGQDAFLKLLVAQISHQDPLKPMDDTAFVAQLAQFSALEQAIGTNSRLELLATQQQGLGNTETAALVGQVVTVKGNRVTLDGQSLTVPISFTLGDQAKSVTVSVRDTQGKVVRSMQLGEQGAGVVKVSWDGKDATGTTQPNGAYTITVEAKNEAGGAVDVLQESTGTLKSVSFDKGYSLLELDNGVTAPASDLLRVNAAGK